MKPATTQDPHKTAQPGSPTIDEGIQSASLLIPTIADGALDEELSESVFQVLKDLRTLAAKTLRDQRGMVTLKLGFVVSQAGDVVVAGDVTTKTPKFPPEATRFFLTKNGNLTQRNPKQQDLPFRQIGEIRGPAVDPNANTDRDIRDV